MPPKGEDFSEQAMHLAELGWCYDGTSYTNTPLQSSSQPSILDNQDVEHPTIKEAVQADIDHCNESTSVMVEEHTEAARQALAQIRIPGEYTTTPTAVEAETNPDIPRSSDWEPRCPYCGKPNEYDRTVCDPVLPTVCQDEVAYASDPKDYYHLLSNF